MTSTYILVVFLILLNFVVLPLLISYALRLIGNHTQQLLVNSFGNISQVTFGGLGVIIHELAHLITAMLFGQHIDQFRLLEPFKYKQTKSLGYVDMDCPNPNLYNQLGDFFIGISPCFACSGILWLIHNILFINTTKFHISGTNLFSSIQIALSNVITSFSTFDLKTLLYLVLVIMISSTGYGLSKADMQTTWRGVPYWIVLTLIISVAIIFLGLTPLVIKLLWKVTTILFTFLLQGLLYIGISWIVLKIAQCVLYRL